MAAGPADLSGPVGRSPRARRRTDAAKFADYFDFSQPLKSLPSHRILAMYRGEAQGVLTLTVDPEAQPAGSGGHAP